MICGGEIPATATRFFDDGALRPTFDAVCGPTGADAYQETKGQLYDLMSLPEYRQMWERLMRQGRTTGEVTGLYLSLLMARGCPSSFAVNVQSVANEVVEAQQPMQRYEFWNTLVGDLERQAAPLAAFDGEITPDVRKSLFVASLRLQMIAKSARRAAAAAREWALFQTTPDTDTIIALQGERIQDLAPLLPSLAEKIMSVDGESIMSLDADAPSMEEQAATAIREFQRAWRAFANPFGYADALAARLKRNGAPIDVSVKDFNFNPDVVPENPFAAREIVTGLTMTALKYSSAEVPVEMEFAWDAAAGEMQVTFKNTWALDPFAWAEIKEFMLDTVPHGSWRSAQTTLFGRTIFVSIAKPSAQTNLSAARSPGERDRIASRITGFARSPEAPSEMMPNLAVQSAPAMGAQIAVSPRPSVVSLSTQVWPAPALFPLLRRAVAAR